MKCFFLTLVFLLSSNVFAFNFKCIGKGRVLPPRSLTEAWKVAHNDWSIRQYWTCCEGLILSSSGVCEDHSLKDARFKLCQRHPDCEGSNGCFPQHTFELYTTDSEDPREIAYWKGQREIFVKQQATLKVPEKRIGEACYKNMECQSYKCEDFKCQGAFICRHAHPGEVAPHYVKRYEHKKSAAAP